MSKTIQSDADADALLAKLARATGPVDTVTARMWTHVPRAFLPFLAGLLAGADKVVLQGARLAGDTVALDGPRARRWTLSRRIHLAFHNCTIDDAFLHALLDDWTHGQVFDMLEFFKCDYDGDASRPARDLSAFIPVDTLRVRSCEPAFTFRVGMLARFMDVHALNIDGADTDFAAWLPYVPTRNLRSLTLSGAVLDTDGAEALADVLRHAGALTKITLERELEDATPLPVVVADAIGARTRERIRVGGIPVSTENLGRMVRQQTSLLEFTIFDLETTAGLAEIATMIIRQNSRFRRLTFLRDAHSRAYIHLKISPPLLAALLQHTHVVELGKTEFIPALDTHLRANERILFFTNMLQTPAADLRITSVFCTGALRDAARAQLDGATTADAIERIVARAVVAANVDVYRPLHNIFQILPCRALLGEEFRMAIRDYYTPPTLEPALVSYVVVHLPNALSPGIRVHALRGSGGAPGNLTVSPSDTTGHELLATDDVLAPELVHRLEKMRSDVTRVDFADLPRAVRALAATLVEAPARICDQLCLLAVVRASKHVLSSAEVAVICAEFGDDARLPLNPYTYPLTNGGMIARMPEVLSLLRKTFALPVLLVRILGSTRRVPTAWLRDSVLPIAAAVEVFHHVVENDEVLAEEAVRILITFDVIFPVSHDRAVFPKSRSIPSILCRALAYLHSRVDDYRVLSQDDTGSIAFLIKTGPARGAQMTARLVDDAIAIEAGNPDYADEAQRMTRVLAPIVDS